MVNHQVIWSRFRKFVKTNLKFKIKYYSENIIVIAIIDKIDERNTKCPPRLLSTSAMMRKTVLCLKRLSSKQEYRIEKDCHKSDEDACVADECDAIRNSD